MNPVTLPSGVSLRRVAEIVRHAMRLAPGAWTDAGGEVLHDAPAARPLLPADDVVLRLFTLLRDRGVEYLLVGGIALLRYTEGRNTEDVDLLMSLPALRQLPEIQVEDQNEYFLRGRFHGLQVDVLLTANPLFAVVQRHFVTVHRFAELDVPTATPGGLVLLKLYALTSLYRQGQFERVKIYEADIAALLYRHRPDVEGIFSLLRPHVDDGQQAELRTWVNRQMAEIARFERVHPPPRPKPGQAEAR